MYANNSVKYIVGVEDNTSQPRHPGELFLVQLAVDHCEELSGRLLDVLFVLVVRLDIRVGGLLQVEFGLRTWQ
jgi:hypothetical protein